MENRVVGIHTIEPDVSDASLPGISIQETADVLGVSISTVRRWCVVGRLRSERVSRPQGVAIRVHLDQAQITALMADHQLEALPMPRAAEHGSAPQAAEGADAETPPSDATGLSIINPRPLSRISRAERARAEMTISLISATASQVVAPFMREYEAVRATADVQARQLRDQAELIGRLSSDLDHAREVIRELKQSSTGTATMPRWVSNGIVIVVCALLLACVAVAVVLLGR